MDRRFRTSLDDFALDILNLVAARLRTNDPWLHRRQAKPTDRDCLEREAASGSSTGRSVCNAAGSFSAWSRGPSPSTKLTRSQESVTNRRVAIVEADGGLHA